MYITMCRGYELEKEMPNTSEDFFNRSEITIVTGKTEKTFHVLYVRYFEEVFAGQNPALFKDAAIKDVLALICIIQNESLLKRKRFYVNEQDVFLKYLDGINLQQALEIPAHIREHGRISLLDAAEKVKMTVHKEM
ncbi:hypothetical protein ACTSEZ_08895 [Metabacillus sp. JX24]|uniref:hypothetical protein n=1 Tax=Metabacillus sp. JX24 TaxID=3240759 RepID=UPI00350F7EC0